MCHLIGCIGKNTAYFRDIPTEDAWTECNVQETSDKANSD